MKKITKSRNLRILKLIEQNNLGSISRAFLSSLVIIFFFYSLPILINFTSNNILNTKEFKNNSKAIFKALFEAFLFNYCITEFFNIIL